MNKKTAFPVALLSNPDTSSISLLFCQTFKWLLLQRKQLAERALPHQDSPPLAIYLWNTSAICNGLYQHGRHFLFPAALPAPVAIFPVLLNKTDKYLPA